MSGIESEIDSDKHTIITVKTDKSFILYANHLEKEQRTKPVGISSHPLDSSSIAESYYKSNGGIMPMIENVDDDFDTSEDTPAEIVE